MARLTDAKREEIINQYHLGMSQYQLAKDFEVSPATINKLVKGLTPKVEHKYKSYINKPFKEKKDGFVYVVYFKDSNQKLFHKIGLATDLRNRIKQHQTSLPFSLYIAISYYVEDMRKEEKELHRMFNDKRILGEWFTLETKDLLNIKERSLRVVI